MHVFSKHKAAKSIVYANSNADVRLIVFSLYNSGTKKGLQAGSK